jgi:hypothetical protein
MEQMQNFHKNLSSTTETPSAQQRCLAALTRLDRNHINSLVTFVPWFIWSTEAAADA